jgi:hypothetical protein
LKFKKIYDKLYIYIKLKIQRRSIVKKINLKKGISLIVLVITIIVIIILAGAVILSLSKNNPIASATEASFKVNIDAYNSELTMYISRKYVEGLSFNADTLNATTWDGSATITGTVKEFISTITAADGAKYSISGGKLIYCGANVNEKLWAQNVGIPTGIIDYKYTGALQTFIAPVTGTYKLEAWGAQGGGNDPLSLVLGSRAGQGGYTSGDVSLTKGQIIYVYVGGQGELASIITALGGYNGGGSAIYAGTALGGGGGATDFRLQNGLWNDIESLKRRILVAGGGGGSDDTGAASGIFDGGNDECGGNGGGLIGQAPLTMGARATYGFGTQALGGVATPSGINGGFGFGGAYIGAAGSADYGGGGGGYYGGASGGGLFQGGGGGSSFVTGYAGADVTYRSLHIGLTFNNVSIQQGTRLGNGAAKITLL